MKFDKLFLGYKETKALEYLLIREGYITEYIEDFDNHNFNEAIISANKIRINCKSTLLRLLLLFEKIDSNTLSLYNLDSAIDFGLINEYSNLAHHGILLSNSAESHIRTIEKDLANRDRKAYSFIKNCFYSIDSKYNTGIQECIDDELLHLLHTSLLHDFPYFIYLLQDEIYSIINDEIEELFLYNEKCYKIYRQIESGKLPSAIELISMIEKKANQFLNETFNPDTEIFDIINTVFRPKGKDVCKNCIYKYHHSNCYNISNCEYSLQKDIALQDFCSASLFKMPLFNGSLQTSSYLSNNNPKIIDGVYRLFSLNIPQSEFALPTPSSISEMLRLRNRPEIKSFREVFANWCAHLQCNDEKTIQLINKDLNRAKEILEKYSYLQNKKTKIGNAIKKNLFSIIFECIGAFIPFISLPFSLAEPWIDRKKEIDRKESEWLVFVR